MPNVSSSVCSCPHAARQARPSALLRTVAFSGADGRPYLRTWPMVRPARTTRMSSPSMEGTRSRNAWNLRVAAVTILHPAGSKSQNVTSTVGTSAAAASAAISWVMVSEASPRPTYRVSPNSSANACRAGAANTFSHHNTTRNGCPLSGSKSSSGVGAAHCGTHSTPLSTRVSQPVSGAHRCAGTFFSSVNAVNATSPSQRPSLAGPSFSHPQSLTSLT